MQSWALDRISFTVVIARCSLALEGSWKLELEGKWKCLPLTLVPYARYGVGLFFAQVSYYINVFFDNFCSGRTWKIGRRDISGGHKSVDNFGEGVTVITLTWWQFEVLAEFPSKSSWTFEFSIVQFSSIFVYIYLIQFNINSPLSSQFILYFLLKRKLSGEAM